MESKEELLNAPSISKEIPRAVFKHLNLNHELIYGCLHGFPSLIRMLIRMQWH